MRFQMIVIGLRCSKEFIQKVDEYRRDAADLPSRPEALRRLVMEALPPGRRRSSGQSADGDHALQSGAAA
jgi:hypothetical protein